MPEKQGKYMFRGHEDKKFLLVDTTRVVQHSIFWSTLLEHVFGDRLAGHYVLQNSRKMEGKYVQRHLFSNAEEGNLTRIYMRRNQTTRSRTAGVFQSPSEL